VKDLIKEHPYLPVQFNVFAEGLQRRFSEPAKGFERIRQ